MQINESLRFNGVFLRRAGLIRRTRIQESTPKAETSPKADKGIVGLKIEQSHRRIPAHLSEREMPVTRICADFGVG
jgi:hypothetical protein